VSESVYEGKFQTASSESGTRPVPIGPVAHWLIGRHRLASLRKKPEDMIFSNRSGGPLNARNLLQRDLKPVAQAAGIGNVYRHQLRHIHSSMLHDFGVPVKIAQEQLGHASVETTLTIYTHVIPKTHRKAVESLERVLLSNAPTLDRAADAPMC
jgi:integrase